MIIPDKPCAAHAENTASSLDLIEKCCGQNHLVYELSEIDSVGQRDLYPFAILASCTASGAPRGVGSARSKLA
jgi:hypothetical protein